MLVTFQRLGQFGRLGNQLFQIAATVGAARRLGCDFAFPAWEYAEYFEGVLPATPAGAEYLPIYRERTFYYREIELSASGQLLGYFQSERYFAHCAAEFQSVFKPKIWIRDQCAELCGKLFESATCSIHVRRGDYVGHPCFVDLSTTGYYEAAMQLFPRETKFVVFSDDIDFCRRRFRGPQFVFVQSNHEIVDLHLMSLCAAHIIANSSFSWWGAWLNNRPGKRVIAPRNWFQGSTANPQSLFVAGPPHYGYHNTRDLIPAEWQKI